MRLSISSFRLKLLVFVTVLIASAAFLEVYCRFSNRFRDPSFSYLQRIAEVDASKAVLGDSHVGDTSYIPHYAFLGQPGQQPGELLLLVRSLYMHRRPERVMVRELPRVERPIALGMLGRHLGQLLRSLDDLPRTADLQKL